MKKGCISSISKLKILHCISKKASFDKFLTICLQEYIKWEKDLKF